MDKFIIAHFLKEKKGKIRFYEKKKNATILYSLAPSFNTFTYTGLTRTLLSYMQKMGVVNGVVHLLLQHSPPCYNFRTTARHSPFEICNVYHMGRVLYVSIRYYMKICLIFVSVH